MSSELVGVPWEFLVVGLGLCLSSSALGFKRVEYFVSLGYAASIAAQAVVMPLLYRETMRGWVLIQSALLLTYGIRLGSFLLLRASASSFQKEKEINTARGAKVGIWMRLAIWLSVSVLYVLMFLPALLTLSIQAKGQATPSVPFGVALMLLGLCIEACADWQKSRFKKYHPTRFCDVGLYRILRFPNYFGEMVFWFGGWVAAISAYQSPLAWGLGGLGFLCIELVMLGSSRRLELKQSERYSADSAFQAYSRKTPILFPLVPLYSLKNLKGRFPTSPGSR